MVIEAFAPAKINLTLHITGQRTDGYHLLDSLVVFPNVGDLLRFEPAHDLQLEVVGRFSEGVPTDDSNLVLRAAKLLARNRGAKITLDKRLPAGGGIGGGSADAAAAIRGLCALWGLDAPAIDQLVQIGADVPVCMEHGLSRMSGMGEEVTCFGGQPDLCMLLVNPGVHMSTPAVFRHITVKNNAPMQGLPLGSNVLNDPVQLANWLKLQRNDMQDAAVALSPEIGDVLDALGKQDGCLIHRMSGSGSTCFGIFQDRDGLQKAAERIQAQHPNWWVEQTDVLNSAARA